jgi:hypothetical protein
MLFAWSLTSYGFADGAGTLAAPWAQLPDSTRQAALGGSAGALVNFLDALNVNPAGLAGLTGDEIAFTQEFWLQGLSAEHAAYAHALGDCTVALAVDYLNFGSINQYSLNAGGLPVANGTYSPTALNLQAGFGIKLSGDFNLGLSAEGLYQSLSAEDQAWAIAADLGVRYVARDLGLRAGLAVQNLGTQLDGANLPLILDLSAAWSGELAADHRFSLTADGGLNLQQSGDSTAGAGLEYVYQGILALRLGYRAASYGNLTGLSGLSSGIAVKVNPFELGYALTALGDLGTAQEISLKSFY